MRAALPDREGTQGSVGGPRQWSVALTVPAAFASDEACMARAAVVMGADSGPGGSSGFWRFAGGSTDISGVASARLAALDAGARGSRRAACGSVARGGGSKAAAERLSSGLSFSNSSAARPRSVGTAFRMERRPVAEEPGLGIGSGGARLAYSDGVRGGTDDFSAPNASSSFARPCAASAASLMASA